MRRLVLLALIVIGAAASVGRPVQTTGAVGFEQLLFADGDDYDTGGG